MERTMKISENESGGQWDNGTMGRRRFRRSEIFAQMAAEGVVVAPVVGFFSLCGFVSAMRPDQPSTRRN
jgi:hypothetical protein